MRTAQEINQVHLDVKKGKKKRLYNLDVKKYNVDYCIERKKIVIPSKGLLKPRIIFYNDHNTLIRKSTRP